MAPSGTRVPCGARRSSERARLTSAAAITMSTQAGMMSGGSPTSTTSPRTMRLPKNGAGAAAGGHVAVEALGELRPPHVGHGAPEHRDQQQIRRSQRHEIHERQRSIARPGHEPERQRDEHRGEQDIDDPQQARARRASHQPPVDGQQRRGDREHHREQQEVVPDADFERQRLADRAQHVIAAEQAEAGRRPRPAAHAALPGPPGPRASRRSPQRLQGSGQMRFFALSVAQREARTVFDRPALQHQPRRHVDR